MRRILITGARGFIGRHLIQALLSDKDTRLILTDRYNRDYDFSAYSKCLGDKSLTFYNLDIRNRDDLFRIFKHEKIDTCIHLAAKVNVEDSIRNPDKTMDINVKGTVNVLEACSCNGTKNFVFASSASVYGNPITLPISEEHELTPISPYGRSKLLAEQYVSSYRSSGKIPNTISLRIFNVYGEGQYGNMSVIIKFAERLAKGLPPVIYGDGTQKRDFVSIVDVVSAILLSLKAMEERRNDLLSSSWIFNIGTGIAKSINELCNQMIRVSGLNLKPIYQEITSNADIKASCADITKAKNILKFVPKDTLETDLKNIVTSMISAPIKLC